MHINKIIGFAVGPIASAILGLVLVPTIAWSFSPEDVGRLNLLQVTLSFSLLLTLLGLDQAYLREYHGCENPSTLLKACFLPGFLVLLACVISTMAFGRDLARWLYGKDDLLLYTLTLFCIFVNYISRFLSLILRMQERGLAFSMSQVIPKVLQLVLLGAVVWLGVQRSFLTLLLITVASMVAVVLVYTWNTRLQWCPALKARPSAALIRTLLKFGTPLVFSGLAYWGLTATSALLLRSHSTLGELGVYAVTNSFAGVAVIFQSIFSVVWAPTVYKWVNEGVDMARVDGIASQALAMACGIFALVGCLSWLTDYLLPQHYAGVKYLVVCAIAPPLLYTLSEITAVGIGITRRTMLTVWVTLAALVTNVLLNLWLLPTQGAAGAVTANAVAYAVFFMARTEASAKVWRQFSRARLHIHVLLFIGLAIATVWLGPVLPFHYAFVWLLVLSLLALSFKTELVGMLAFTKQALAERKR